MSESDSSQTLSIRPIGHIRTKMKVKFDAPHQPKDGTEEQNVIELLPNQNFERALQDLEGFDRIWLIWWFHKNDTWRPRVRPPRGDGTRRGVFATRSPHRPNPIGLTSVPLLGVSGLNVYVGNTDLLDGTPIFDIKPYLSGVDAYPDAKNGWVDEMEAQLAAPPQFVIKVEPLAAAQLDWLKENWKIDFFTRASELLARDPSPHRTRRIVRYGKDLFRMGCGAWRIFFSVKDKEVRIERIARGYPDRLLHGDNYTSLPDKEAQIAFGEIWKDANE